jgi:spore germination protein GerM
VVTVLAVILGGCGVPAQDSPERLGDQGALPVVGTPVTSVPGSTKATVWFVRAERLVPVERSVPEGGAQAAVRALLAGPTAEEVAAGMHTELGPSSRVSTVDVNGRVANVAVDASFSQVQPDHQVLAVAQLVYTVTEVSGIDAVAITVDGEPVEVPGRDGALQDGPFRREHFSSFAPSA